MKYLISSEKLIKLQKNSENLVILDCRFDLFNKTYGVDSYNKSHIKGAYLLDVENQLSMHTGEHGGNHPFQDPQVLKEILEGFGISNDTTVVAYDDGDLNGPSRLLYQLLQLGLKNVYVLNGAIPGYIAAGGEMESTVNKSDKKGHIELDFDPSMTVDIDYVKGKLYDKDTTIIDSRAFIRYKGDEEPVYPKAGHIPSAKNYFLAYVVDNGKIKDVEFLKEHFKDLDPGKEIILSCGSGISACVNSLALRQLGIDHKLYVGSFSDWISYPENEVKTGVE